MTGKRAAMVLTAISIVLFVAFYITAATYPMYGPVPWHLGGHVFDRATNALSGVRIRASGTVRVTALNHIVGTSPRTFAQETETDSSGGFSLDCRAAFFQLVFSKAGYRDEGRSFEVRFDGPYDTNQDIQVFLGSDR